MESGELRLCIGHERRARVRSTIVCALNYSADRPYSVEANDP